MAQISAGDQAPDFETVDENGNPVKLSDFRGKKVVLYFYPKDDTSGCTLEAQSFTALKPEFDKAGVAVIGISPDSAQSHDKFKAKYGLDLTLAADEEKEATNAYGVWVEKSMYGRKFMGVERSTFLIDRDGKIARAWIKVKVPGHADAVLAAAKAL